MELPISSAMWDVKVLVLNNLRRKTPYFHLHVLGLPIKE
jgi:hypothetical protein